MSNVAYNLVSNFEVALMKKLWQFFVLSHTLRVAVPSPPPPTRGGGRVRLHVGYLEIPATFQLVCHAFLSITFAFSGYSTSVEVCNCHSDGRQIGTQIGQIGITENRIGYQSQKPISSSCKNRKPSVKKRKICKPQWTPKPKNQSFLAQKPKNQSKK